MSSEGRRFALALPDWGQDHLSPEVVVAFVDDELDDGPFLRAARHLDACIECATQVAAQGQARSVLRSAEGPSLPSSLMSSLFSIPQDTDLPGAPMGLAVSADGQFVSVLRPERVAQNPAPPNPAVPTPAVPTPAAPVGRAADPGHPRRPPSRRMRFGAGAAMSGLALGAMALGATGVASDAPAQVAGPARGVFNGPLLGSSANANLRIPAAADAVPGAGELTPQVPPTFPHRP